MLTAGLLAVRAAAAQVSVSPPAIRPAAWERIALRVVNQTESPIVEIRWTVPEAIQVLGVDAPDGWIFWIDRATDSTAQQVGFSGGGVDRWELEEFSLMGRLVADSRQDELVFPVTVLRADGSETVWARTSGAQGLPPVMNVAGTTEVSTWAVFAAAGGAFGLAVLALAVSLAKRRADV